MERRRGIAEYAEVTEVTEVAENFSLVFLGLSGARSCSVELLEKQKKISASSALLTGSFCEW
jgi:hypothetical protein